MGRYTWVYLFVFSFILCKTICAAKITAYVVPHSHDDVGWIETVEQYFNGAVQYIYTTVVEELAADPSKRFIAVEMAFFYMWWTITATEDQKQMARKIIQNKQLEFVSGGWVMQDEALTTFAACVDQMTEGHQFILSEFGAIPQAGWQIDPFGATGATATMFSLMGFQSHVIDRINHTTTLAMMADKTLEFLWQGSPDLGAEDLILTHTMPDGYCSPMQLGYDFEFDNAPITAANIAEQSRNFVEIINQRASYYMTPNVLLQYGCDFHYKSGLQFKYMGKVIDFINANVSFGIEIRWATLSEYFDAVLQSNVTWPTRSGGDWGSMPAGYNSSPYLYWTGFYTSRSNLKGHVRRAEATLKSADAAYLSASLDAGISENFTEIQTLRRAFAQSMHHDGVTGTSRGYVVDMYHEDLYTGEEQATANAAAALSVLLNPKAPPPLSNTSEALLSLQKGQIVPVVVHNSLGWSRSDFVSIPIGRNDVIVTDQKGNVVPYQVNPAFGSQASAPYNLYVQVQIAPLGFSTYFVSVGASPSNVGKVQHGATQTSLENEMLHASFDKSGQFIRLANSFSNVSINLRQYYMQYDSTTNTSQNSGAYVFRPTGPAYNFSEPVNISYISGKYVSEIYQEISPYIYQVLRLFTSGYAEGKSDVESFMEVEATLGLLPENKEIIVRYQTDLDNRGINPYTGKPVLLHYTDENAYTTVPRYTDFEIQDFLGGNYYPMVMRTNLIDTTDQRNFGIVSDRSHGTASFAQGDMEVMLHRRVLSDDAQGLAGAPLNDTDIITPVTRLMISGADLWLEEKKQSFLLNFPPNVFYGSPINTQIDQWAAMPVYTPLTEDLQDNIHLMSFKSLDGSNKVILRFQHLCSSQETVCSGPAQINIAGLFVDWNISEIEETTLTANQVKSNTKGVTEIVIRPMEVRTFLVYLEKR